MDNLLPQKYSKGLHFSKYRSRRGSTSKLDATDNGHLLSNLNRLNSNKWCSDKFRENLRNKFDKETNGYNKWRELDSSDPATFGGDKNNNWSTEPVAENLSRILSSTKRKENSDLEYIPGDITEATKQHPTRQLLLDQKFERDNGIEPDLKLDKLYLGDEHNCKLGDANELNTIFTRPPLPTIGTPLGTSVGPPVPNFSSTDDTLNVDLKMPFMSHSSITEKPNERCPSPVIPAFANFELAKRMHSDNLEHQPLPDCVADIAFRKLQIGGGQPGLALDIDPIATGLGVRTHNAGPTHCTKMKVFRPRTCGVVPKDYGNANGFLSPSQPGKKMNAIDLAIQWDYKASNFADEPRPPKHIDGSNGSSGPAVFSYVKTPRDDGANMDLGRSAGVFQSTSGEADFFDKDILQRKTDFTGRNTERDALCGCDGPPMPRARSVSRDYGPPPPRLSRFGKQYESSPNVLSDQEYKALREKYLAPDGCGKATGGPACRRANPGFFQRARTRLCHKVAPAPIEPPSACCLPPHFERPMPCKAVFRAGIPKYDASGHFLSQDSGCSVGSLHANRVLVVPRPRNPYSKRNYDIETLVPPFKSHAGGAGEGGYPEHWRLASVYQHAFKPVEQRRRPLIQTVYK